MADKTKIEWADATWNPVRGCSPVSGGCENCYAQRDAHRFSGPGQPYEGLTRSTDHGPKWTGRVRLVEGLLDKPRRWKRPRRIFVNSMSDLFHERLTSRQIALVFSAMGNAPQHTFLALTKRSERMRELLWSEGFWLDVWSGIEDRAMREYTVKHRALPHLHLGVSVEDQAAADERIPDLRNSPANIRWLSMEPLLGSVELMHHFTTNSIRMIQRQHGHTDEDTPEHLRPGLAGIDGVVIGGESGPRARPCGIEWIRFVIRQCDAAGIPVFVKQLGAKPTSIADYSTICLIDKKGGDMDEWPDNLKLRELPRDDR